MQGLRFHENECVHFPWNAAPALPMLRITPLRGSNRSIEATGQYLTQRR
jgi:hypothetical protein